MASLVPILIGVLGYCTEQGNWMASGMALLFFFLISFVLSLVSAGVAWAEWKKWQAVDKVVGLAPICLFLATILFFVLAEIFLS